MSSQRGGTESAVGRGISLVALALVVAALTGAEADAQMRGPWPAGVPIVPAPIQGPLPPAPPPVEAEPATRAARRVLEVVERVRTSVRTSRYQHRRQVRERDGVFHWDCSLMVEWVLERAAPRSVRHLDALSRPLAVHFVQAIERAPTRGYRRGWQRIERIQDVRPGDVFAWRRPDGFPSRNTGHVGFVLGAPRAVPGAPGMFAVRVADATASLHQDDTRPWPGDGGFGIGTLAFLTDAEGRGTHYGWAGTRSQAYVVTPILFGRVGP